MLEEAHVENARLQDQVSQLTQRYAQLEAENVVLRGRLERDLSIV